LLDIDSRNFNAYYLIGCSHEKLEEVEYAIENFTIVIELDPTHVNAFLARGACLNKLGKYKEALDDYDIALKLDSEKSKIKKIRNQSLHKKASGFKDSEDDLHKPHENKLKPLDIDTSNFQGNTEVVMMNRQNSNSSFQKVMSVRNSNQEESSLQDISFSQT
jgi:tetratricopeptide (TPR) repeat protein